MVNETGNRNRILEMCKFRFLLVHWIDPRSIEHSYACLLTNLQILEAWRWTNQQIITLLCSVLWQCRLSVKIYAGLATLVVHIIIMWALTTRSTGTVHTSTKAHLTSVTIRIRTRIPIHIRIRDLDGQQHLIICSLAHCQPSLNANWFGNFCTKLLTNRQTDRQTVTKT